MPVCVCGAFREGEITRSRASCRGRTANIPFRSVGGQIQPDFRFAYRYLRRFLDVAGPPESIALIVWTSKPPSRPD